MKQNSFGQGVIIFLVVIGILYFIGAVGKASEPKCIKAGCDNKEAADSSYCYLHKPYSGSSSYSNKSSSSSSTNSVESSSGDTGSVNESTTTNNFHLTVVESRSITHMISMTTAMMTSIWMEIMTTTDMRVTAIMQTV